MKEASEHELNDAALYDYSVIFITDGGESCNGDVCGVFLELLQKKITIKPQRARTAAINKFFFPSNVLRVARLKMKAMSSKVMGIIPLYTSI